MPSFEHNGLVDMFRENPSLAPLFLEQILHLPLPEHTSVAVVEAALDQLVPVEFRADLVIEVKQGDEVVFAIVLEVQLGEDPDKTSVWPVYLTVVRATAFRVQPHVLRRAERAGRLRPWPAVPCFATAGPARQGASPALARRPPLKRMSKLILLTCSSGGAAQGRFRFTVDDRLIETCLDIFENLVEASYKAIKHAQRAASRGLVRARILLRLARFALHFESAVSAFRQGERRRRPHAWRLDPGWPFAVTCERPRPPRLGWRHEGRLEPGDSGRALEQQDV